MKHPFLKKLKEKRESDKKIENESSSSVIPYISRINFQLCYLKQISGIMSDSNLMSELYTLDEEDIAYFEKKLSTIEAEKEHEYQEKLKALNKEYGKESLNK